MPGPVSRGTTTCS